MGKGHVCPSPPQVADFAVTVHSKHIESVLVLFGSTSCDFRKLLPMDSLVRLHLGKSGICHPPSSVRATVCSRE